MDADVGRGGTNLAQCFTCKGTGRAPARATSEAHTDCELCDLAAGPCEEHTYTADGIAEVEAAYGGRLPYKPTAQSGTRTNDATPADSERKDEAPNVSSEHKPLGNPDTASRWRARRIIAEARKAGDVLDFGLGLEAKIMAALDESRTQEALVVIDPTPQKRPGKRGVPLPGETAAQAKTRDGNVFGVRECSWLEDDAVALSVTHFKDGSVNIVWDRPARKGYTTTGLRSEESDAIAREVAKRWYAPHTDNATVTERAEKAEADLALHKGWYEQERLEARYAHHLVHEANGRLGNLQARLVFAKRVINEARIFAVHRDACVTCAQAGEDCGSLMLKKAIDKHDESEAFETKQDPIREERGRISRQAYAKKHGKESALRVDYPEAVAWAVRLIDRTDVEFHNILETESEAKSRCKSYNEKHDDYEVVSLSVGAPRVGQP